MLYIGIVMKILESHLKAQKLDFQEHSCAQDYAVQALQLYRIGESADMKKAQMLWEYAKEYMMLNKSA